MLELLHENRSSYGLNRVCRTLEGCHKSGLMFARPDERYFDLKYRDILEKCTKVDLTCSGAQRARKWEPEFIWQKIKAVSESTFQGLSNEV